ncbi:psbP-like protein 1, chloroplastic [Chenopodium quinoa]|uniref:PsbP C-terminal domain-containing protein n=1 Tax=Chenopodium quinoa TaxID=63459 RepID=A0A803N355_CHEQI|nr:psbP-like protein 1, chloroplastic [Chenopodium quinoa]
MASLQQSILPSISQAFLPSNSSQVNYVSSGKRVSVLVKAERVSSAATASCSSISFQDGVARRKLLALGASIPGILLFADTPISFAAESKKGFLPVTDKKDGYTFLYPFGWQEVSIEGEDKVFKDVIEPLESVSVNLVPTSKEDVKEFGPPDKVAETLIKKVLAPNNQKTKLVQAKEQDVEGKTYYTFEFTAQAPNYTRHALSVICINKGKFYTLTTGANERRWDKMKDRLYTVVDSFRVFNA